MVFYECKILEIGEIPYSITKKEKREQTGGITNGKAVESFNRR